jgi:hypothetical protein
LIQRPPPAAGIGNGGKSDGTKEDAASGIKIDQGKLHLKDTAKPHVGGSSNAATIPTDAEVPLAKRRRTATDTTGGNRDGKQRDGKQELML